MDKIYTLEEVAGHLKLSKKTVSRYIKQGKLFGYKFGNRWRFNESELKRFIKGREKKGE
jgi:excisionase family DNA binding protein